MGIWLIIVRGSYRSAERVFIWLTIPFFAYPIAAILAHPDWSQVGQALIVPHIQTNCAYLLLFVATAGTTITPYMQLYLQSATVERGAREEDLPNEQRQAVAGAIFADLIAAFIIIATGATLYDARHPLHRPAPPTPPRPLSRSPVSTPKRCSASACSAPACSPARSCPSPPATSSPSRSGFEKGLGRSPRRGARLRRRSSPP